MTRLVGRFARLVASLALVGSSWLAPPAWGQVGVVSERSEMVAAWDFSEWFESFLIIDDVLFTPSTRRPAQYTSLPNALMDPGGVFISEQFGTLFLDGSFGSTALVPNLDGTDPLEPSTVPFQGSLLANKTAGVPFGTGEFDNSLVLEFQGQLIQRPAVMTAVGPVSIVFRADVSTADISGTNWSMSFGGTTGVLSGGEEPGNSAVGIEFAPSCSGYVAVGEAILTPLEEVFDVALGPGPADTVCVRLSFDPVSNSRPSIDNVAIFVPEPATGASAMALSALGLLGWRRRRRPSRS